jgi:hypothetical protein
VDLAFGKKNILSENSYFVKNNFNVASKLKTSWKLILPTIYEPFMNEKQEFI